MIYYIGHYNHEIIREEGRAASPPAGNKMNYVISVLEEVQDDDIEIVSPVETRLCGFVHGDKRKLRDGVSLKTFDSFSGKNRGVRLLGHLLTNLQFAAYLLRHVNSDDQLVVYHSLALMRWVRCVKALKKCRVLLEVEELYADVKEDQKLRNREIAYLQTADSYIYITELLRNEVNTQKAAAIAHGTYRAVRDFGFRFHDGKIHVVYAGTFSRVKGGVFAALSAAQFLSDQYVLEILGKGSDEDTNAVLERIQELSKIAACRINFVGYRSGDDFHSYIQACDIGLSTQQPDATFNATSFPSKILMYMSNGLRVVSVRIPAVETSDVGEYMYYYDEQKPEKIAEAVMSVNLDDHYDGRSVLNRLHATFRRELKEIL